MNVKRIIISIILGIAISSALFCVLITINRFSIDYSVAGQSTESFSFLGMKYLEVSLNNGEATQQVFSGPIGFTGIVASGLVYGIITLFSKKKEKNANCNVTKG